MDLLVALPFIYLFVCKAFNLPFKWSMFFLALAMCSIAFFFSLLSAGVLLAGRAL
jgi:hypothetical protein